MSENVYLDLAEEAAAALYDLIHTVSRTVKRDHTAPRVKEQWATRRIIHDRAGKECGTFDLSQPGVIPFDGKGHPSAKLYRVEGKMWAVETQPATSAKAGRVQPITNDEAMIWLNRNGWTIMDNQNRSSYQITPKEKVYVINHPGIELAGITAAAALIVEKSSIIDPGTQQERTFTGTAMVEPTSPFAPISVEQPRPEGFEPADLTLLGIQSTSASI